MDYVALALRILDGVIAGTMTLERAQQAKAQIEAIVADGRNPTVDEWSALFTESDELDLRLDAAAKREG